MPRRRTKKGTDGRRARADRTTKSLTEAATSAFAERGYERATVRDIAGEAGVNAALVSYHFGSKEGLLEEVVDANMGELGRALREAAWSDPDVSVAAPRAVRVYLEHLRTNEAFPRVIARALLDRDDRILVVARYLRPLFDSLRPRFTDRPFPEHEITTIFAASLLPVLYSKLICDIWGWDEGPPLAERRHDHLMELAELLFARYATTPEG